MSNACTFFDESTGEVHGAGAVGDDTLEGYFQTGMRGIRLEVTADRDTQYVDIETLEVRDYTAEEKAARRAMRLGWIWQMPERIAVDQRPQSMARVEALDRVNAERDRRIAAFDRFTFNGTVYDGDAAAKENITDAAAGAVDDQPLPEGFTWRTFDNSDVLMTNADILALAKAFRIAANLHKFTMHAIARALKDAAEADLTNTELDAITWPE
jgi:hypothetical protein